MEKIAIVDKKDRILGYKDKLECHLGEGILHRAFSVFVFDNKGRLLIQQRSKKKSLWPLYWSNTCCSHLRKGESYQKAAERRLKEEMGFTCSLKLLGKFQYQAKYKNIGSENEICAVLVGQYTKGDKIRPDPNEVADWRWLDFKELQNDIAKHPERYSPWFGIAIKRFKKYFKKYED